MGATRLVSVVGLSLVLTLELVSRSDGCTTAAIGRKATADGSTYILGTADAEIGDFRMAKVAAGDFDPQKDTRPIYPLSQAYPHLVNGNRSYTWSRENLEDLPQKALWTESVPFEDIPQAKHTYQLIESGSGYGLVNEHGLTMGESTCGAKFVAKPKYDGGHAVFEVGTLMKIAMERTKTAREAIALMGSLAENYGYYGAEYYSPATRFQESGETVTIADGVEAWVFHVLPDDTGRSAIWAAQRVPDDSYCVVANRFVIRAIDPKSDDFMYSANLFEVARRNQLWRPQERLDFLAVYSMGLTENSKYATDRIWRAASLWAPSAGLKLSDALEFPATVKVDRPLELRDILRLMRDHYEGSELDLTQGIAGGAFGDPDRYDKRAGPEVTPEELEERAFTRSISMFRTLVWHIQRSNANLPKEVNARILVGAHEPSESVVVPVYVYQGAVPEPLAVGSLFAYNEKSLYWQATLLGNWVHKYYIPAHEYIAPLVEEFDDHLIERMASVEEEAKHLISKGHRTQAVALLQDLSSVSAVDATDFLKRTFLEVVARFHDGIAYHNLDSESVSPRSLFYPRFWLEAVGFLPHAPMRTQTLQQVSHAALRELPVDPVFAAGGTSYVTLCAVPVLALLFFNVMLRSKGRRARSKYFAL